MDRNQLVISPIWDSGYWPDNLFLILEYHFNVVGWWEDSLKSIFVTDINSQLYVAFRDKLVSLST